MTPAHTRIWPPRQQPRPEPEVTWRDAALCAEIDPELFFPEKGESSKSAKRACRQCVARQPCLEYALEHEIPFGVWGGLSARERRRLSPTLVAA